MDGSIIAVLTAVHDEVHSRGGLQLLLLPVTFKASGVDRHTFAEQLPKAIKASAMRLRGQNTCFKKKMQAWEKVSIDGD